MGQPNLAFGQVGRDNFNLDCVHLSVPFLQAIPEYKDLCQGAPHEPQCEVVSVHIENFRSSTQSKFSTCIVSCFALSAVVDTSCISQSPCFTGF